MHTIEGFIWQEYVRTLAPLYRSILYAMTIDDRPMRSGAIAAAVMQSQSAMSVALRRMRDRGIVATWKRGQCRLYEVTDRRWLIARHSQRLQDLHLLGGQNLHKQHGMTSEARRDVLPVLRPRLGGAVNDRHDVTEYIRAEPIAQLVLLLRR